MKNIHYKLASDNWDQHEFNAISRVLESKMFTMGEEVRRTEIEFAKMFGVKYCVMSNSGSSANLLAIGSLIYSGKLKRGDEVIVPAVSWSTSYHPLQQYGLFLKFVDIDLKTLNYDLNQLKNAVTSKTKMILVVNLLGNNNKFQEIQEICYDRNIFFIEDNCESMGSTYKGKYSGTFGIMGTFSSFYSHHIATMEGGYTVTNDRDLYNIMKSLRAHGWTRDISDNWGSYEKKKDSFYEKFNFILPGYNLRPLEIEAAIASVQLKKLNKILDTRKQNAKKFLEKIKNYSDLLGQREIESSSWFGFSIVLIGKLEGKRRILVNFLEKNNIETRPIVAGNFTKNECIKYFNYIIFGTLKNADYIHENGFFVGNNSQDLTFEIEYFFQKLDEFIGGLNEV